MLLYGIRAAGIHAIIGCAALAMTASPAEAQTQQQIDWCVNNGNAFSGDLAIGGCTASIQSGRWSGKDLVWAFINRGNAYVDKKDHDLAIADYDQAIRLDPKHALAFNGRGIAYRAKKDYDRAIADYDQAIRLDPNFASAFNSRCFARAVAGRELSQALADCNESLRLLPDQGHVLDSRGLVQLRLGAFDRAIADYDAALRKDPKRAHWLYGRGMAKLRSGDKAGGESDIEAAKAIQADIADVYAGDQVTRTRGDGPARN